MKTVREVAIAVRSLQRELEQLKKSRFTCDICAIGEGCNGPLWTNAISDPIHTVHSNGSLRSR